MMAINQAVISTSVIGQVEGQVNKLKNIKRIDVREGLFSAFKKNVLASSKICFHQKVVKKPPSLRNSQF